MLQGSCVLVGYQYCPTFCHVDQFTFHISFLSLKFNIFSLTDDQSFNTYYYSKSRNYRPCHVDVKAYQASQNLRALLRPVPLPDLYFDSLSYPVAAIVSSAGGTV